MKSWLSAAIWPAVIAGLPPVIWAAVFQSPTTTIILGLDVQKVAVGLLLAGIYSIVYYYGVFLVVGLVVSVPFCYLRAWLDRFAPHFSRGLRVRRRLSRILIVMTLPLALYALVYIFIGGEFGNPIEARLFLTAVFVIPWIVALVIMTAKLSSALETRLPQFFARQMASDSRNDGFIWN